MQDVHITCAWEQLHTMVRTLEEQYKEQPEEVYVLEWGYSCKRQEGYVILEWSDEVDAAFLTQLEADVQVIDYCVYTVPTVDDYPFGAELIPPARPVEWPEEE
jgi:hypothetical protein